MGTTILIKRGQSANLPTLIYGELAWTVDDGKLHIGTPAGNVEITGAGGDATYLRLDTSNDPLTAGLTITGSSDEVQLKVTGNATQTSALFQVLKSGPSGILTVNEDSWTLNADAATGTKIIGRLYTTSTAASGTITGKFIHHFPSPSGASTSANETGVHMRMNTGPVPIATNYTGTLYNLFVETYHDRASACTVDDLYGVRVETFTSHANATITNAYGISIQVDATTGTITNAYGIKIDDVNTAATLNYSIFTGAGAVQFGDTLTVTDSVTITGSSDVIQLLVTANGTQTNDIFVVEASGGSDYFKVAGDGDVTISTGTLAVTPAANNFVASAISMTVSAASIGYALCKATGTYSVTSGTAVIENFVSSLVITGNSGTAQAATGYTSSFTQSGNGTLTTLKLYDAKGTQSLVGSTITNFYAYYATAPTFTGTVTNQYGLYIENVNSGATLNYAIITNAGEVNFGDGVTLGSPTGGNKGAGTLNAATDLYKNNSAYTNPDYALESWVNGGAIVKFAHNPGAEGYYRLPLDELNAYVRKNLRLPRIDEEPSGIFARGDMALEKIEELTTYILELHDRLRAVEALVGISDN